MRNSTNRSTNNLTNSSVNKSATQSIPKSVQQYLASIGRVGGKKSRRNLSSADSKKMLAVREAKKLYLKHHTECFSSYDINYKITSKDVPWVAEQLIKNGNRKLWLIGKKLCPQIAKTDV